MAGFQVPVGQFKEVGSMPFLIELLLKKDSLLLAQAFTSVVARRNVTRSNSCVKNFVHMLTLYPLPVDKGAGGRMMAEVTVGARGPFRMVY